MSKVQKHRDRLKKILSNPDYYLDDKEKERVEAFFSKCVHHWKSPFEGQKFVPEPWQMEELFVPLLCIKKKSDDTRLFRRALILLPRKNGKSFVAAVIQIYLMLVDGEGLEGFCAASKMDQAKLVFNDVCGIIRNSPLLKKRLKVWKNYVEYADKASTFKPLSADRNSLDGLNSSSLILDELHKMDRDVYNVLLTSTGARKQPLTMMISTAGDNETGPCCSEYEYSSKVLDGIIEDDSYFGLIYEADTTKKDDWMNPERYREANPNLGVSISEEYLTKELKKAIEVPSYRAAYRRYHLNWWETGMGQKWLPLDSWKAAGERFTADDLEGQECFCGLDMASTTDLSAFSLLFPQEDGSFRLLTHYWIPADNLITRVREDRVPYDEWEKEGWIETTAGNVIDTDFIFYRIKDLSERFRIRKITFDPAFTADITPKLMDEGLNTVSFKQSTINFHPPSQEFEKLVLSEKIKHDRNPVTQWCVSNVKVHRNYDGLMKPEKDQSIRTQRIDGVIATIMALDGWMRDDNQEKKIDYSTIPKDLRAILGI